MDSSGGGNYLTIQAAIDASLPGDLILVMPGTYVEDLAVRESVTIRADTPGSVLIYPATHDPGVGFGSQVTTTTQCCKIVADNVVLEDLIFDGDNPSLAGGIDARNGIISNYSAGDWNNLTVRRCEVRNVLHRAIYASRGSGHLFEDSVAKNASGVGLESAGFMFYSASGIIQNNLAEDCGIGISTHAGSSGTLLNNRVESSLLGVLCNGTNAPTSISSSDFYDCEQGVQLIAINADVAITDNRFVRNRWGISFFGSNGHSDIWNNQFLGEGRAGSYGIYALTDLSPWGYNDVHGSVQGNEFSGLGTGILMDETVGQQTWVVDLAIGGSEATANNFSANIDHNIALVNCDDPISATWNSWGVLDAASIEGTIHHGVDDPILGIVDFSSPLFQPWLSASNVVANDVARLTLTGATPSGIVDIAFSFYGADPFASIYGTVYLTPPIGFLPSLIADPGGTAWSDNFLPPRYTGRSFWFQALDITTATLSNGLEVTVH
ncbi:MAG: right-handed parallel beta-helix repeat-containing protein [Planctomycetota bacterium]|nr:right-handed parallel beta-helix repeat-containing protein [Planctomycetota bacterium]